MTDHEHLRDLLPELALGALPETDAAGACAHLDTCAECSREYEHLVRVAALLPLAVEDAGPAPAVKEGLMLRIAREPRGRVAARPGHPWRWYAGAAAAGLTLLFAGVAGGVLWERGNDGNDAAREAYIERQSMLVQAAANGTLLTGTGRAGDASAVFVHAPRSTWGYVWVEGLPVLPAGKAYQAWFASAEGRYDPAGTFTLQQGGVWLWSEQDLGSYAAVGITVEDAAGAREPSQEPFLVVRMDEG